MRTLSACWIASTSLKDNTNTLKAIKRNVAVPRKALLRDATVVVESTSIHTVITITLFDEVFVLAK